MKLRFVPIVLLATATASLFGCGAAKKVFPDMAGAPMDNPDLLGDMTGVFDPGADMVMAGGTVDAGPCFDKDENCKGAALGLNRETKFPLAGEVPSDKFAGPIVSDGVGRDMDGNLVLQSQTPKIDFLWVANTNDWSRGTISRIDYKNVKEAARYLTVTCYSNFGAGASKAACDGTKGCCAGDDFPRYVWRQDPTVGSQPKKQTVDQNNTMPSRTAMDFNGDIFVANRAFNGQSSVTKIANNIADCRDYNGNKKIDTSSDVNGDGLIQTDCNNNHYLDDIDDVKSKACVNGMKQEFYGLDDECILWTTNTNVQKVRGRPLTLGPGDIEGGLNDAWAGSWLDGKFFRLNGTTGKTVASVDTPAWSNAYGAVTDSHNIIWVAATDGPGAGRLGYFDATNPTNNSFTGGSNKFALKGYGIAVDRDQNIWEGGWDTKSVFRYVPDRSAVNGFDKLGIGHWTQVLTPGVNNGASGYTRGIAVDLRGGQAGNFYAWVAWDGLNSAPSYIARIDTSLVPLPKGADNIVDGSAFQAFKVQGLGAVGVGVDVQQNIWAISQYGSAVTRMKVDANGAVTPPNLAGAGNGCPVGDRCVLKDSADSDPQSYTYSDFTGFGLSTFRNPHGVYSLYVKGCDEARTDWTQWWAVTYDADVPMGTSLGLHVRSGETAPYSKLDATWTDWYPAAVAMKSPLVMHLPVDLVAQGMKDQYLQMEFVFSTTLRAASPKIKSIDIAFKCMFVG